jgi:hypothetical protein
MELKIDIGYSQILEIVKQLPVNQVVKLMVDAQSILEIDKETSEKKSFQQFLLSAPTMSENQYELFTENRKLFNQWRTK